MTLAVSFATAAAGIATGALTFVSFVDTRALRAHVRGNEHDVLIAHFAVWWPAGRDMMVPVLAICALTHSAAYYTTGDPRWIISGACLTLVAPYTKLALGEDIDALRAAKPKDVGIIATRFCKRHHVRTVLAATAFGLAIAAS